MTDPHPEGLYGVAAPDPVSAPRGGGFAFDEGADPYYEGLVTSRFPCLLPVAARGYFRFFGKERPDRTGRKTDGRGVMSEKAEAAVACFREGFNCSQAVLSTWGAEFGLERETALRAAAALGAVR
jgi:hypothetical protein